MKNIPIDNFFIGDDKLTVICGPCVIESEKQTLQAAKTLKKIFEDSPFNFIFKSSYDKANRLSIDSFRGPGLEHGLEILQKVKDQYNLPILTDVHSEEEAIKAAAICDMLQIPAFLCRQTDLTITASNTKKPINIKKGQFMSPFDMKNIIEKVKSTGNENILVTDRGSCFGYNNLVSDFRAIPIMQDFGHPVCFDVTHSLQQPGGLGKQTGGSNKYAEHLAKAAIAVGVNAIFIEAHENPKLAKSDSATMISFDELPYLLNKLAKIHEALR